MQFRFPTAVYITVVLWSVNAFCEEEPPAINFIPHGQISLEGGQISKGMYHASNGNWQIDHVWIEKQLLRMGGEISVKERLRGYFMGQGEISFTFPMTGGEKNPQVLKPVHSFKIIQAEGNYCFGDVKKPWLNIGFGYFPYKYNPDVRNLGEFMFRTGTYPIYFENEFDYVRQRLLGFKLSSEIFDIFHQDLLLFSETNFYPPKDWSLAYIGSVDLFDFVEIGAGFSSHHLLSVYGNYSRFGYEYMSTDGDPVTPEVFPDNGYIDSSDGTPDTIYYSFAANKVMARIAVDPKHFIPLEIFGENDLRLYVEACLVGTRNYKFGYDYPEHRLPVAFGINLPAFNVLDVLNIELEYLDTPYPLSSSTVWLERYPYPPNKNTEPRNPWKWSIFAQKTFLNCLALKGQIARDHMRLQKQAFLDDERSDMLEEGDHWFWMLKAEFKW